MRSDRKSGGKRNRFVESLEPRQLLSGGTLDTTFNSPHGVDSVSFGNTDVAAYGMAVQSDGKIVEVGNTSDYKYALIRLNTDGTLDTTFGSSKTGEVTDTSANDFSILSAVAIQSDGKIVVAGDGGANEAGKFIIMRFLSNGTPDTSFGSSGVVSFDHVLSVTGEAAESSAVEIQNDGKIIIAGEETQGLINANQNMIVARLNTNGSLDTSFGNGGKINLDLGEEEETTSVAIDYNGSSSSNSDYGRIIVAGHQIDGGQYKIVIARYNTNGTADKTFNGNGVLLTTLGSKRSIDAEAVTIESGGKIVIAGSYGTNLFTTDHHFLLARFNVDGSLDKTFGTGGVTITGFGGDEYATSLVIGGFGQQLIAGGFSSGKFALAAYTLDGAPFTPFGTNGQVVTKGDNKVSSVQLALAPNHTIVAAGGKGFNTARYLDIAPDAEITSKDRIAAEGTTTKIVGKIFEHVPNPAVMAVTLSESVPVSTRIYVSIGGTAHPPNVANIKPNKDDYTLSGLTIPTSPVRGTTAYLDIPAGQTSATITLTPVDDTLAEPTETASFTILPNADYGIVAPAGQTMSIQDNDSPVTTTLNPTADAYVRAGAYANDNYGTVPQLAIKKSGTVDDNRVAYFTFDLSGVSSVNNAVFSIFGGLSNSTNTDLETQLFAVADTSWTETGITFNNKPAAGTTVISSTTVHNTATHTHQFDLTSYVQSQFNAGHKIISIMLSNPVKSGSAFIFNSREASSNQPTLTVT